MINNSNNKNKSKIIKTQQGYSPVKRIRPIRSNVKLQRIKTEIVTNSKPHLRYDHTLYHKTIFHLKPILDNPQLFTIEKSMSAKVFHQIKEWRPLNQKIIIPHPINIKQRVGSMPRKQLWLRQVTLNHITAKKWIIYSIQQGIIKGYKYRLQHQIASLTKLLTFYTAYQIIKQNYIGISTFQLLVTSQDNKIGGTKLPLIQNDDSMITLQDALYAMMIGSANNIASAIANNLGNYVLKKRNNKYFSCFDVNGQNRQNNLNIFLELMIKFSRQMNLKESQFVNAHGLSGNLGSSLDVAKLASQCFKIPLFCKIASTKRHFVKVKQISNEGEMIIRTLLVDNTNKLIEQGCLGGKTGCNKIGGDNFVGAFDGGYLVVVLGSAGKQQKFNDCMRLVQWVNKKISLISQQ